MPDQLTTSLLQHWMKTVITGYGHLDHKLLEAQQQYGLTAQEVILENEISGALNRLSVYTNGYVLRLLECLSADYAMVQEFTGPESFRGFATAYLLWKPSSSFTLYDLGKSFPEFLQQLRPQLPDLPPEQEILLQLPAALALLERARQEAILALGTESQEQPGEISMTDLLFYGTTVACPPCLKLLRLPFPVLPVYEALQKKLDYDLPELQTTYLAVSRKNYRLVMEEIEEWIFVFLEHCQETTSLLTAVQQTAARTGIASDTLLADLYIWLPLLQQRGFITPATAPVF